MSAQRIRRGFGRIGIGCAGLIAIAGVSVTVPPAIHEYRETDWESISTPVDQPHHELGSVDSWDSRTR
jgi:hypothetical protein